MGHSPGVFAELLLHGDVGEVWMPHASQERGWSWLLNTSKPCTRRV